MLTEFQTESYLIPASEDRARLFLSLGWSLGMYLQRRGVLEAPLTLSDKVTLYRILQVKVHFPTVFSDPRAWHIPSFAGDAMNALVLRLGSELGKGGFQELEDPLNRLHLIEDDEGKISFALKNKTLQDGDLVEVFEVAWIPGIISRLPSGLWAVLTGGRDALLLQPDMLFRFPDPKRYRLTDE